MDKRANPFIHRDIWEQITFNVFLSNVVKKIIIFHILLSSALLILSVCHFNQEFSYVKDELNGFILYANVSLDGFNLIGCDCNRRKKGQNL
jgi:hypothetical protein